MAVGIVLGILVGNFYANQYSGKSLSIINATGNKLNDLLHIIDAQYVDEVDMPELVESAMPQILNEQTGYIKINSFSNTTYPELLAALAKLNHQGFKGLIIDLRHNGGGFLQPAVQMANEFLSKNKLILYTEGRNSPREEFRSDGRGAYQTLPLIILIDEATASASEIFAGAVQDNDRGTIIGRRSFGKGLVQEPIEFRDGSMLRLTIARYYTPSGRCLQKPYVKGDKEDYEMDIINRARHGEFYSKDSIRMEGQKYKTSIGRTVYGGGGIMPDIFIPDDTLGVTSYFQEANLRGFIFQFAFLYVDSNRKKLKEFTSYQELVAYLKTQRLPEKLSIFMEQNGLKRRNLMLRKSYKLFEEFLYTNIINDLMEKDAAIQYANETDPCVLRALSVLAEGKSFPTKKEKNANDTLSNK